AERHAVQVMLGGGNGDFAPGPLHPVGAAPLAVVAADLDMDGVPDIATANALDDTVTILFGDGNGGLRDRATWPTLRDPRALIATAEEGAPVLYALSSRTSGVQRIAPLAGPTLDGAIQSPATALAASDLDGDLVNELLVASAPQGEISLLRESSGLKATELWQGPRISAAFPIDLDGDAIDELALLVTKDPDEIMTESGSPGAPVLTIVRSDGTALFELETGLSGDVQQVRVADLNGDGRRDLLVVSYGGLVAHLQRAGGTFEPLTEYLLFGSVISATTLGDLDDDGAQDLVIATTSGSKGAKMLGLSFAAEAPKVLFERKIDGSVSSLIPVDRDGDAYLDVLGLLNFSPVLFPDVARGGEQVPVDRVGLGGVFSLAFESPGIAWACTNTGVLRVSDFLGPAQAVTERLDDVQCDSVALVDLDGDTGHDLIVRRVDESDEALRVVLTPWTRPDGVWTQLGALSFPAANFRSLPVVRFSGSGPGLLLDAADEPVRTARLTLAPAYASEPLFAGAQTLRFVDVDGDGIHDVLGTGHTIGVAIGHGDGGFGPLRQRAVATVLPDAKAISQTVISDLDADGRDEIFIATRRAGWSAGFYALTVGTDGALLSRHLGELPGGSVTLLPADVDHDGSQDLFAVVHAAPLRTALWRGDSEGELAEPEWAEQPGDDRAPTNSYRFADLDSNGRLDLVGVSLTDGITMRAGLGDGIFASAYQWSPLRFLSSVSFGDLNLDTRLDLVGVRMGRLLVAHGGEGAARLPEVWLTEVRAATIAELDGDGSPEVLTLGLNAVLQVVRRDDAGRLDIARHPVRGPTPTSIHVEDLDGDGAPELILQGNGHLTVLMQRQ
ncbi:MAG TPA: VCBS repeat-containing protein, partial [Microthrixaceae bacterium]|nr:VCBS repeat-containing protein [Microthrixaceae bacterium]